MDQTKHEELLAPLLIYKEEIFNLKWGDSIVVKCPKCGGKLHIERSEYNGHIHIICLTNKDVIIFQ